MQKLILCLCLSAAAASLVARFEWEKTSRREWHAYSVAVKSEMEGLP